MKIEKYTYLNNSKYKIYLDKIEVILYEDVIVNNNLLTLKEITDIELEKLLKENEFYELYYQAIKYLKTKLRSEKEIKELLRKEITNKETINKVIEKLKTNGYINDLSYTKAYIHDNFYLKSYGPLKIKSNLIKLGIDEDIIDNEIELIQEDEILDKIIAYAKKQIKLNKNKSEYALKEKILTNLINIGYPKDLVIEFLEDVLINETNLKQKEYDKLYKKLSLKYSDNELELRIKQKLYEKGFR